MENQLNPEYSRSPAAKLKHFKTDNSMHGAKTTGIMYRYSKNLQDGKRGPLVPSDLAKWGSDIYGIDCGDDWVRVGDRYLPVFLNGVRVLVEQDDEIMSSEASSRKPDAVPCDAALFGTDAKQELTPTLGARVQKVYTGAKDLAKDVATDPNVKTIAGSAVGVAIVGGTAGGTVGAATGGVVGGAVGIVGAPFTLGLSIPVSAVVGGSIGLGAGVIAGGSTGFAVGGAVGYRISKGMARSAEKPRSSED